MEQAIESNDAGAGEIIAALPLRTKLAGMAFAIGKMASIATIMTLGVGVRPAAYMLSFAAACILTSIVMSIMQMRRDEDGDVQRLQSEVDRLRNELKKLGVKDPTA